MKKMQPSEQLLRDGGRTPPGSSPSPPMHCSAVSFSLAFPGAHGQNQITLKNQETDDGLILFGPLC
jgi:hypothetical protein